MPHPQVRRAYGRPAYDNLIMIIALREGFPSYKATDLTYRLTAHAAGRLDLMSGPSVPEDPA